MHSLNPNDLVSVSDAYAFLASLPKSYEFWDHTSPELRDAYKAFYRALRREVRHLIRDVLPYDWNIVFEGVRLPDSIIDAIKYHTQNGAPYYVWQCGEQWRSDSRCPDAPTRLWIIEKNPDRCTVWVGDRQVQQYRLQHARFPSRSALNFNIS